MLLEEQKHAWQAIQKAKKGTSSEEENSLQWQKNELVLFKL